MVVSTNVSKLGEAVLYELYAAALGSHLGCSKLEALV